MPQDTTTEDLTELQDKPELQDDLGTPPKPAENVIDISKPVTPIPKSDEPKKEGDAEPDAPAAGDPLANQMFADILEGIGEVPDPAPEEDPNKPAAEDDDEPKKEPVADPNKPAEPAKPAADPATKKPLKFELPSDLSEPVQQEPAKPAAPPAKPAPQPAPAQDPDADWIASLPEDVRDELVAAELAERLMGDKYAGHKKKLTAWFKGMDAEIERLKKENPERTFGPGDTEYQTSLAELRGKKPAVSRQDAREIERKIVRSEVKEEVIQELYPLIDENTRKTKAIELRPKVDAVAGRFAAHIHKLVSEASDLMKPIMEDVSKLGDKAREQYALELDIIEDRTSAAKSLISEYLMVKNGAVKIDPARLTPAQQELNQFLVTQGNEFVKTGGKKLIDGQGRRFIPNHQMNAMARQVRTGVLDQSELEKHWTFNDDMIAGLLALKAKVEIEGEVKYEMERSKKYGFERKPAAAAQPSKPAEPVKPPTPTPKAKPRPSMGGGERPDKPVQGYEHVTSIADDLKLE